MTPLTSIIKITLFVTVLSSLSGCRAVVTEQPSKPSGYDNSSLTRSRIRLHWGFLEVEPTRKIL